AVEAAGTERIRRLFRISMPMWSNGLRFIDNQGITVDDLQVRARAACNIGGLERWGWITVGETGAGRRPGYGTRRGVKGDTVLRPTRAGAYARRVWPQAVTDTEQRWRARFGDGPVGSLREALALLAGPMPSSPPEVHAQDGFFTHVLPAQAGNDDDSLAGLLGRELTGLTVGVEQGSRVSLPVGGDVRGAIGDG